MLLNIANKFYLQFLRLFFPLKFARLSGVIFGEGCKFIRPNFGTEPYLISIGNRVEITKNVHFITHDGGVWIFREKEPEIDLFGPITIGDNVMVGLGAKILPGVKIGSNCIIGAGSVVVKNVPDNSIVAGVPARVISNIDSYYKKNKKNFMYIRSMSPAKKEAYLKKHFKV